MEEFRLRANKSLKEPISGRQVSDWMNTEWLERNGCKKAARWVKGCGIGEAGKVEDKDDWVDWERNIRLTTINLACQHLLIKVTLKVKVHFVRRFK